MGTGSTKILSYDEASKRFLPADLESIETTFRDLNNGSADLSYTSFKRDVFANFLPEKLATRLYHVCTSSSKSCMSFKDLVCCLALIYYGTQKERMQLLYLIFSYNVSSGTDTLRWQQVQDFLSQCGDHSPEELDTLFQNHDDIVTQEKFLSWLGYHQGHTTTITDWLMDQQRLHELTQWAIERVSDQYSILAGVTHLSEIEVKELDKSYHNLHLYANTNRQQQQQQQITLQAFSNLLTPVLPPILIPGVFDAFDENRDGCIDFKEFVCGVSAACRGPQFERYKFLFRVFDRDLDGRLNRSDIVHMSSCLIDVAQFVYVSGIHMNDSPDIFADDVLQENANGQSDHLKPEDFLNWCASNSLIKELLELIFQICHVVLGLKPASKHDEISIVKQFLRREQYPFIEAQSGVSSKAYHWINCNRSTSKPGSSWYLISMDWWARWEATRSNSTEQMCNPVQKKNSVTKLNKLPNGTDHSRREPGDIDNASLIDKTVSTNTRIVNDDCVQLKLGLVHRTNFEMVPELLWLFLRKYYRCNGAVVCRKVTYRKKLNKPELDLYPLLIKIYRNQSLSPQQMQSIANNNASTPTTNNSNNSHSMYFVYPLLNYVSANMFGSSTTSNTIATNTHRHYLACSYFASPYQTVRSLAEELSAKFGRPLDEIRIWVRHNENDLRQIDFESPDDVTCDEAGFDRDIEILFETRNSDLTWPEELFTLATRSKALTSQSTSTTSSLGSTEEEGRGLIGLSNLGNTCFLNASVQCLSHSYPLTFYFLHKYHLFEINKENPIGMQGNIALRYGQLVAKLWGSVRGPLAPFELRGAVAKFGSSRFTDFQQHDSQEFLSFLLDGLHEDLNRVHHKPYVELKDSDDRPDEDVAYEHWANHLARNTSIIVDLFHGLLRSQVKCRACELKSVRFDPFNILSLPLPMDTSIYIEIKLIRLDGSRPTRYGVKLDGDLSISHLKSQFASLSLLSIEQIGFFDIVSSCPRRNLTMDNDLTKIKQLGNRELLAYELPLAAPTEASAENEPTNRNLPITRPPTYIIAIHRRLERQERYLSPMTRHRILFFGQPILIPYDRQSTEPVTNAHIYQCILTQLERLLRKNNDLSYVSNHALDCDDSLGERYPFTLKYVTEDGKKCSICSWNRFCLGCPLKSNNQEFKYTSGNLAIEWESSAYYLGYLSNREQDVETHSSVRTSRSWTNDSTQDEPSSVVRLEDCLESFIKWENLDNKELFNCKGCKKLQPADKKLDIWKLPPCLIFHIKRFQLSNNRWIKSSRPVRFPIQSFHPSKYLAQRSPTGAPMSSRPADENLSTSSSSLSSFTATTPEAVSSSSIDNMLILSPSRLINGNHPSAQQTEPNIGLPPPEVLNESVRKKKKRFGRSKKKFDVSTQEFTLNPPRFSQMQDRTLSFGDNSFDADNAAYNLHAFVCHYGVIGGGHYVAFVKNHTNQQWYCFNDSSCKPVSESTLEQCSSSAYLLFYERECLDYRRYMPDVKDKKPVANELPLTGDDRWCSLM